MQADGPQQRRSNLIRSLQGPYAQVLYSLIRALTIMVENKRTPTISRRFKVNVEVQMCGSTDDVVFTADDGETPSTDYCQLKFTHPNSKNHSKKISKNACGGSPKDSIEAEIPKYFDDWYFFIKDKHEVNPNHRCILLTNRSLDAALKQALIYKECAHGIDYYGLTEGEVFDQIKQHIIGKKEGEVIEPLKQPTTDKKDKPYQKYRHSIACNRKAVENASRQTLIITLPTRKPISDMALSNHQLKANRIINVKMCLPVMMKNGLIKVSYCTLSLCHLTPKKWKILKNRLPNS